MKNCIMFVPVLLFSCCANRQEYYGFSEKELIIENLLTNITFQNRDSIGQVFVFDSSYNRMGFDSLFSTMGTDKLLFFRFDTKPCGLCLEKEMENIAKLADDKRNHIVLLLSVNNFNEYKVIGDRYKSIVTSYLIEDVSRLPTEIERNLLPYYFVMEQPCFLSSVYIPNKNTNVSNHYLNTVLR